MEICPYHYEYRILVSSIGSIILLYIFALLEVTI